LINLPAILRAAKDLEPLPASVSRLAALVARPDVEIRDIVEVVNYDQGLTARLLRVANSAASAAISPITTVKGAVVRLGTGTVLSLATGASLKRQLERAIPVYGLSEGELWRHSIAAALAAEAAPPYCRAPVPPEAFTAALLHDVGKLVLARFLYPEVKALLARTQSTGGLLTLEAEMEVLETHHGDLGGLVTQRWRLPETIVKGVTHHHYPDDGNHLICDVVHLADAVAHVVATATAAATAAPCMASATATNSAAAAPATPASAPDSAAGLAFGAINIRAGARERLGLTEDGPQGLAALVAGRLQEVLERYN